MHRLSEAWIAPPATRELRELVRHRAKLVHLRTSLRCHVHAVLAGQGIMISVSDLFGLAGTKLLTELVLPSVYQLRVQSLRRLIDAFDVEIDVVSKITSARLRQDLGYAAVQTIPGVGPVFAAVLSPRSAISAASAARHS